MDIAGLRPEQLFLPDILPQYCDSMHIFQNELVRLNADLFIAEKVIEFPLDLFTEPLQRDFFRLVVYNSLQAAVLILTRLTTDQGRDCCTLIKFHNKIVSSLRPEYEQAVRARLGAVHFHVRTRAVRSKVRAVRDDLIAHLVVGTGESGCLAAPKHPGVTLAELKALRDDIVSLFDALSFGCGYHTWVLQYSPQVTHPKDTDARSDVERVLDSVARDSAVFNLPEAEPEYWPIAKAALGAEAVQRLNAYRKRMGFPEA